jgi:small subunit ribosomal protein S8
MKSLINIISAINIAKRSHLKHISLKEQPSKLVYQFLNILMQEGFLRGYSINEFSTSKHIKIDFKFSSNGSNVISSIRFIGGNSQATFISSTSLWKKEKGQGIILILTSKGLITDHIARNLNLGGKILAIIV